MKKHFAAIVVLCGLATFTSAQGGFILDSSEGPLAKPGGAVFIEGLGLDTSEDINVGVLWGMSASSVTTKLNIDPLGLNTGIYAGSGNWIASQYTGMSDITTYATGALSDFNGNIYVVPGAAAGTTIYLVLQGWTGNSATYNGVTATGPNAGLSGETAPFAITLAANYAPVHPDVHTMGALVLGEVPEPSILPLCSISAAALLVNRRTK